MLRRNVWSVLVSIALATAIHLDWHIARPTTHHLSLGLSWHWLLAIPVFALVAWYVSRAWPAAVGRASVGIVGFGILSGGVLEPVWEYCFADATFEWAFGMRRNTILATFVGMGLVTYVAVLAFMRRRPGP